ncbi:hypothetical protein QUF72_17715 [Desulfobacterales bacterium HSG2]|nr:hypothetical protein [Desulfobacterales bacterium HSG2]
MRVPVEERKELGKTIQQRIKGLSDVSIDKRPYVSEKDRGRLVCDFSIKDHRSRYYSYSNSFRLILNEQGELTISHYVSDAPVSDIDEILSFIAACQEHIERQHILKGKRKKIRDFKAQAIIAQVRNLAKEEKFDFCTDKDTVKLKLYVKLSEKECIELHIPFSKFQEILPDLRAVILSARELHGKGIKFKIKSIQSYRHKWITPDSET